MEFKYDYLDESKTVEWQRKVDEIRQRDNYTCKICGAQDRQVHVHHIIYNRNLHYWEYPNELLITLCKDCHRSEHELEDRLRKIKTSMNPIIVESINTMRVKGVLITEIVNTLNKIGNNSDSMPNITDNSVQRRFCLPSLGSIAEKKQLFTQIVEQSSVKYEKNFIQSFLEYWLTENDKGVLRFETGERGNIIDPMSLTTDYMSIKLENWETNYDSIVKRSQSVPILDELEKKVKEQEYKRKNSEVKCRDLSSRHYGTQDRLIGRLLYAKGLYVKETYDYDSFTGKSTCAHEICPIETDTEKEQTDLSVFRLLYEANQAFKYNKEYNRAVLSTIDSNITYITFCNKYNIRYPKNLKKDRPISELVNKQEFPIKIRYCYGRVSIETPERPMYHDLFQKLNEVFGLKLITPSFCCFNYFDVPLHILYKMRDGQFDFRDDSFENATMKSIVLPKRLEDATYYIEKLKDIVRPGFESVW